VPLRFPKIAPKVTENVSELLERAHYSKRKLDDGVSKQLLKNYLERLDYNHLFFTQKDVDDFNAKYATTLDDDLRVGNTQPGGEDFLGLPQARGRSRGEGEGAGQRKTSTSTAPARWR
jgi:hypothetical protein